MMLFNKDVIGYVAALPLTYAEQVTIIKTIAWNRVVYLVAGGFIGSVFTAFILTVIR